MVRKDAGRHITAAKSGRRISPQVRTYQPCIPSRTGQGYNSQRGKGILKEGKTENPGVRIHIHIAGLQKIQRFIGNRSSQQLRAGGCVKVLPHGVNTQDEREEKRQLAQYDGNSLFLTDYADQIGKCHIGCSAITRKTAKNSQNGMVVLTAPVRTMRLITKTAQPPAYETNTNSICADSLER